MARIYITDVIDRNWGVSANSVINQIASIKNKSEPLEVIITSPGGQVFEGLAIYHAIKSYPGPKTTTVVGVAASMASIIMMAGDRRNIAKGSMVMIHNPAVGAFGEAKSLRKSADILDQLRDSLVKIYTGKTGKSREQVMAMMDATTYMTDDESITHKFSDSVIESYGPENSISFSAVAKADRSQIEAAMVALNAKISDEEFTEEDKKTILNCINQTTSTGSSVEGADHMEITAELVLKNAPGVADHFRAEGAKSVSVTAEMVPEAVALAFKAEGAKAVDLSSAKAEAVKDERKRIADIQAICMAGAESEMQKAISEGKSVAEFAMAQATFLKSTAGAAAAKAALKSGEKTASSVGGSPTAGGDEPLSATAKAAADIKALRDLGINV